MIVPLKSLNRNNFVPEPACFPRGSSELLTSKREFVLVFSSDAVLAPKVLGRGGHVAAAIRIEQCNHEGIFELALAQLEPPACTTNDVRRLTHGFHTAGEDNSGFAKFDQLSGRDDRLYARSAQPIHGQGGHFDGKAGLQRNVPRTVQCVAARLECIAEDRVIEICGLKFRLLDRRASSKRAQFQRADVSQRAAVFGHRSTFTRNNQNIFH